MKTETIAGLARGLAILEAFSDGTAKLSVSEASSRTEISPASARRCLRTLVATGYLRFDGKYYWPTPRVMRLGSAYLSSSELGFLAKPRLSAARDKLNEAVSLSVRDDQYIVFIARAEVERIVTASVSVGTRLPIVLSAAGHVWLAEADDEEAKLIHREYANSGHQPTSSFSEAGFLEQIQQTRENAYGLTDGELEAGVLALAVPVRDSTGALRAAMTASAFASRVSKDTLLNDFLPVLQAEAELLGRVL